jgi:hypothetical protein
LRWHCAAYSTFFNALWGDGFPAVSYIPAISNSHLILKSALLCTIYIINSPYFQNITMPFLAAIAVFFPLVLALAFNAPEVTHVAEILPQGWSPWPIEPPQFNKELLKRQTSLSLSLIKGPDGICGYQFGQYCKFRNGKWLLTLMMLSSCPIGIVQVSCHLWICYSIRGGQWHCMLWFNYNISKMALDIVCWWDRCHELPFGLSM